LKRGRAGTPAKNSKSKGNRRGAIAYPQPHRVVNEKKGPHNFARELGRGKLPIIGPSEVGGRSRNFEQDEKARKLGRGIHG